MDHCLPFDPITKMSTVRTPHKVLYKLLSKLKKHKSDLRLLKQSISNIYLALVILNAVS